MNPNSFVCANFAQGLFFEIFINRPFIHVRLMKSVLLRGKAMDKAVALQDEGWKTAMWGIPCPVTT